MVQIAEVGRIFQFIPTRGSVLPFFFPERECIGYYTPGSWVELTVYKFNTLPLYKKEWVVHSRRPISQGPYTFPLKAVYEHAHIINTAQGMH